VSCGIVTRNTDGFWQAAGTVASPPIKLKVGVPKADPAKVSESLGEVLGAKIKGTVFIRKMDKDFEIEVTGGRSFPVVNSRPELHIGAEVTHLSRYPKTGELTTLIFSMSGEAFAKTKEGEHIMVKYNPDSQGHWDFGALDKSKIVEAKKWGAAIENGLEIVVTPKKAVLVEKVPIVFNVTFKNTSDKSFMLFEKDFFWDWKVRFGDWQVIHLRDVKRAYPQSTMLDPGRSIQTTVVFDNTKDLEFHLEWKGPQLAKVPPVKFLPVGKYSLVIDVRFVEDVRQERLKKYSCEHWTGTIATNPVTVEITPPQQGNADAPAVNDGRQGVVAPGKDKAPEPEGGKAVDGLVATPKSSSKNRRRGSRSLKCSSA
jgi:hypothetical protein